MESTFATLPKFDLVGDQTISAPMLRSIDLVGGILLGGLGEDTLSIETGKDGYEAILDSSVSRLRPVVLAAMQAPSSFAAATCRLTAIRAFSSRVLAVVAAGHC